MNVESPNPKRFAHAPLGAIAALAALALLAAGWASRTSVNFSSLVAVFIGIGILSCIGAFYDISRRSKALAEGAYFCALWAAMIVIITVISYLAAHLGRPLYDREFVKMDAALGFDWRAWYHFVRDTPVLYWILFVAYVSGPFQILFAVVYFTCTGQSAGNLEFWWSALVAMLITALASGIYPAMGTFFHFQENMVHAVHVPHLLALRDGGMTEFKDLQGIVTMPSYHTAQAILFMYVFRGQRRLFPWIVALNSLMLLSTPSMGGHYLVDMLAGAVVAAIAIASVRYGLAGRSTGTRVMPALQSGQ